MTNIIKWKRLEPHIYRAVDSDGRTLYRVRTQYDEQVFPSIEDARALVDRITSDSVWQTVERRIQRRMGSDGRMHWRVRFDSHIFRIESLEDARALLVYLTQRERRSCRPIH